MSPHRTPVEIRFNDTDAMGHVNNAAIAGYLEVGRLAFFRDRLGGTSERLGGPAGDLILARLELDFRRQLRFGGSVEVTTAVERLGRTSITLFQQILDAGLVAAESRSVVVAFDYRMQRPVPLSDEARRLLEP